MSCCTNKNNGCDTCKHSHGDDDIRCYSPEIYKNPPHDSIWEPKNDRITENTREQSSPNQQTALNKDEFNEMDK